MSARLAQIAARKELLLAESEQGRDDIARSWYRWQARTILARQVTSFFRNPWVLAGLGLAALKMPWRKGFKLGGWLWRGWKLFRTVRRMF
jgi:hypothetical protein